MKEKTHQLKTLSPAKNYSSKMTEKEKHSQTNKNWRNVSTQIPYRTKLFFKSDGEIKTISNKQKLEKFVPSRSVLPKAKEILQKEEKWYKKETQNYIKEEH